METTFPSRYIPYAIYYDVHKKLSLCVVTENYSYLIYKQQSKAVSQGLFMFVMKNFIK